MYKNIAITDCHVHCSEQNDISRLADFLEGTGTDRANILACWHSKCLSLVPMALGLKQKYPGRFYCFGAPDLSGYYLNKDNLGEHFAWYCSLMMKAGCDGIKLLEGKPQARKMHPVPDFDLPVWEPFWEWAEEKRIPILWHVNDPENFWDKENAPAFAVSQGWLYDDSYVNNEDQYRQVLTVLKRHPGLKVIFAHFFFMSARLERLAAVLNEFPGVMVDLTPGIEMYENFSKNYEKSKEFFEKYSNRICYGTDIGGRCVLMGEDKEFDEQENLRRPAIVRAFLWESGERLIESDGHYIIGRPPFTMKCLGLSEDKQKAILGGNFTAFAGESPAAVDPEALEELRVYIEQRKTEYLLLTH